MTFNLFGQFLHHVDFSIPRLSLFEPLHDLFGPFTPFSTRGALTTAFVLVEAGQSTYRPDDVGRLIHDDDRRGAQTRLIVFESVEIHHLGVAELLGEHRRR